MHNRPSPSDSQGQALTSGLAEERATDTLAGHQNADLRLESFIPYLLSRLSNTVSGGIAHTYQSRHELSVIDWRVVAILGRFPGSSAQDVAQRGALDKVAVSRSVARLLERALLQRDFADDDRRRSILQLSPEGQRLFQDIAPAALAYEANLLSVLNPAEQASLGELLEKLQAHADAINAES